MSDDKIVKLHADDDPQLEALYQQADKPEPPAHLDNIIKQKAREPQSPRRSKLTPWFAGIAASVLVGVLFIRLYPTALPPHPASYLEEEIRSEHAPATQSMARESVPQAPAVSAAPDSMFDDATQISAERKKSEMASSSPAMKAAGNSDTGIDESDMALEARTQLEHVLELLEQGKTEDAKKAYKEFRQQHPDYAIDPDTLEKLKTLL